MPATGRENRGVGRPSPGQPLPSPLDSTCATAQRSPALPKVPMMAERGVAIDFAAWHGISVAAGTPTPIVKKLNETLNAISPSRP